MTESVKINTLRNRVAPVTKRDVIKSCIGWRCEAPRISDLSSRWKWAVKLSL